jgi:hypothetical protein
MIGQTIQNVPQRILLFKNDISVRKRYYNNAQSRSHGKRVSDCPPIRVYQFASHSLQVRVFCELSLTLRHDRSQISMVLACNLRSFHVNTIWLCMCYRLRICECLAGGSPIPSQLYVQFAHQSSVHQLRRHCYNTKVFLLLYRNSNVTCL